MFFCWFLMRAGAFGLQHTGDTLLLLLLKPFYFLFELGLLSIESKQPFVLWALELSYH